VIPIPTLERNLLIVACAISAGVHAALVRDHLHESIGAGGGFLAATVFLGVLIVVMTRRAESTVVVAGAAFVLGALLASYALATTTGMPVLHPDREPVDGLALATKAAEGVGLLLALDLLRRSSPLRAPQVLPRTEGSLQ
jgi:hypothetical protein